VIGKKRAHETDFICPTAGLGPFDSMGKGKMEAMPRDGVGCVMRKSIVQLYVLLSVEITTFSAGLSSSIQCKCSEHCSSRR